MPLKKLYMFLGQLPCPDACFVVESYTVEHTQKVLTDDRGKKTILPGRALVNVAIYANKEAEQAGHPRLDLKENIPMEGEHFIFDPVIWEPKKANAKKSFIDSKGAEVVFNTDDIRHRIYTELKTYPAFQDAEDC